MVTCCKDCARRHPCCHDHCAEYLSQKAAHDAQRDRLRAEKDNDYSDYTSKRSRRGTTIRAERQRIKGDKRMCQDPKRKAVADWLAGYQKMKTETELLRARFADMVEAACGISGQRESDGSAHTGTNGTALQACVERYLEYSQKIAPRIEMNRREMEKIEDAIDGVPFTDCRTILRERYLTGAEDEVLIKQRGGTFCYGRQHVNRVKKVKEVAKIMRGYDDPSDCAWVIAKQAQALDYLAMDFNIDSTQC